MRFSSGLKIGGIPPGRLLHFLALFGIISGALAAPRIISQGPAAGTYQAFPDVCRLQNGDLFCVFYAGYAHVSLPKEGWEKGGRVCAVRSSDDGKTWSAPVVIYDGPDDDRDPHVAQMRDGAIVVSFFPYRKSGDARADYETSLIESRDGGKTWSSAHRVLAVKWACSAPVREMPDGTRLLGVYHEEGKTAYGGVLRSTDQGKTWSDPIAIHPDSGVRLDAETDLILLKNGTLYAALRGDTVNMHFATSADLGRTWSKVKDIGFKGHCPHFTRLSNGTILLTHRLPQTALHLSTDDTATWSGPHQIDDKIGAYASTVELKDGTVLIVYYEEGANSAIRTRHFKVSKDGIEFLDSPSK